MFQETKLISKFTGHFTVVFIDMISLVEVKMVSGYLKGKFKDFSNNSITCGRCSITVELNHTTDDPYLGLDVLFDQIKALSPNKIGVIVSEDGLNITGVSA